MEIRCFSRHFSRWVSKNHLAGVFCCVCTYAGSYVCLVNSWNWVEFQTMALREHSWVSVTLPEPLPHIRPLTGYTILPFSPSYQVCTTWTVSETTDRRTVRRKTVIQRGPIVTSLTFKRLGLNNKKHHRSDICGWYIWNGTPPTPTLKSFFRGVQVYLL